MLAMRKSRNSTQRLARFGALAAGLLCVALGWNLVASGFHGQARRPEAHAASLLANREKGFQKPAFPAFSTKNIEHIRVGERVLVELPDDARAAASEKTAELAEPPPWDREEIDPATWRRMELAMTGEDDDRFDIVLLRPLAWTEEMGAMVGGSVCLTMPEQGLDGPAEVLSIRPCPPIQPGPGRIVTGTFTRIRGGLLELHLAGLNKPIGVTENHPIYSLDRQEFVHAISLRVGERLQHLGGATHLLSTTPIPGSHRVYNIEVQGDHVYHVSTLGVLAHNASPSPSGASRVAEIGGRVREWLGDDFVVKRHDGQGFVAMNTGRTRRFRIDYTGHGYPPHAHLEVWDGQLKVWVDAIPGQHHLYFQQ